MNVRFYIDPETRMPHIYRHGVDEDEVEDVLRKPGEDRPGREGAELQSAGHEQDDICGSFMSLTRNRIVYS